MTRIYVVVEGQTEEAFVNDVLSPELWPLDIYPAARLLGQSDHRGGHVTFARVRSDVSRLLKHDAGAFVTTMLDYYGLGGGFPKLPAALPAAQAVAALERALMDDLLASLPQGLRVDARFVPYLQLHEFEALLFSDPHAFARGINEASMAAPFAAIRAAFPTPEDINNDPLTAPSKRIIAQHPGYRKVSDGIKAARAVGLSTMRRECPHFHQWVGRLASLADA